MQYKQTSSNAIADTFYSESLMVLQKTEENLRALKRKKPFDQGFADDMLYNLCQGFHFFAYAGNSLGFTSISRLGRAANGLSEALMKWRGVPEPSHIQILFLTIALLSKLTGEFRESQPSCIEIEVEQVVVMLTKAADYSPQMSLSRESAHTIG